MFEKKDLFLLIMIRVDLYHRREVGNTRSTVPVVGAPVVVVARNICAQQKKYKLSGGKMKENDILLKRPRMQILFLLFKRSTWHFDPKLFSFIPKSWNNDGFSLHGRFAIIKYNLTNVRLCTAVRLSGQSQPA